MSLRFHEISEAGNSILNPFTHEKLRRLGEICQLDRRTTQLDLACGKGEMLSQWAKLHQVTGVGVDISTVFLGRCVRRTGVERAGTVVFGAKRERGPNATCRP